MDLLTTHQVLNQIAPHRAAVTIALDSREAATLTSKCINKCNLNKLKSNLHKDKLTWLRLLRILFLLLHTLKVQITLVREKTKSKDSVRSSPRWEMFSYEKVTKLLNSLVWGKVNAQLLITWFTLLNSHRLRHFTLNKPRILVKFNKSKVRYLI